MTYTININVSITITTSHQFLDNVSELTVIKFSLCFLPVVNLTNTNTSTTTDWLHEDREFHFTLLQSFLQSFKRVIGKNSTHSLTAKMLKHLILVKAKSSSPISRAKWKYTLCQEFLTVL